jgi:hypothetical protein
MSGVAAGSSEMASGRPSALVMPLSIPAPSAATNAKLPKRKPINQKAVISPTRKGPPVKSTASQLGIKRLEQLMREKLDMKARPKNSRVSGFSYNKLKTLFQRYDLNDDGNLDLAEFTQMLEDIGLMELHPADVKGLFSKFDQNDDGQVVSGEFATYLTGTAEAGLDGKFGARRTTTNITDMPANQNCSTSKFKRPEHVRYEIKAEFQRKLQVRIQTTCSPIVCAFDVIFSSCKAMRSATDSRSAATRVEMAFAQLI